MQKYKEYKKTDTKWLGIVPSHWEIVYLKNIAQILNGHGFPIKYQGNTTDDIPFLKVSDINNLKTNYVKTSNNYVSYELALKENWGLIPINSILTAKIGNALLKNHRKINLTSCIIDNNMLAISFNKFHLYKSYLFHCVNFKMFLQEGAIPSVNIDLVKNLKIPVPPIEEQENIAYYLDCKVGILDKLIVKKKKQVELLKENRQAIINDVVTKGLNPDVEFQDTNIEYLGRIPKHWQLKKLKYSALCNQQTIDDNTPKDYEMLYVDISNVNNTQGIIKKEKTTFKKAPSRARRKVENGNVIISTVRTYLKAIAFIENAEENLIVSTGFAVIKSISYVPLFMKWLVSTSYFLDSVTSNSTGVSYPAINTPELMNLYGILPPIVEQQEIVKYLDRKTLIIDQAVEKINQSIELLNEYKISLISHVVTGKMKI